MMQIIIYTFVVATVTIAKYAAFIEHYKNTQTCKLYMIKYTSIIKLADEAKYIQIYTITSSSN